MVFGYRYYGGQAIPVKKEQEVINKIIKLRKKGLTYRKVADELNSLKIETKTKKNIWYPKTVRQVYLRLRHKSK